MKKMYTCTNGIELLMKGSTATVADKPTGKAIIPILINDVNLDFIEAVYVEGAGYVQVFNAKGHFLFVE